VCHCRLTTTARIMERKVRSMPTLHLLSFLLSALLPVLDGDLCVHLTSCCCCCCGVAVIVFLFCFLLLSACTVSFTELFTAVIYICVLIPGTLLLFSSLESTATWNTHTHFSFALAFTFVFAPFPLAALCVSTVSSRERLFFFSLQWLIQPRGVNVRRVRRMPLWCF
jgi:hypothetical protein